MNILKTAKFILLIILIPATGFPQQQFRSWYSAGVGVSFTKKLDLKINHLRSYDIANGFQNNFNQSSASVSYDVTKKLSVSGSYVLTNLPSSATNTNRLCLRVSHKINIADALTWTNSLQGEIHSAAETRFRERILYITRISNKKRFDFLNLNLSASAWLYYNIGGNTIRYFDKAGSVIARNSPDGLHRARIFFTANSKVTKSFSISLYYMRQQEFNFLAGETRKMNVVNPLTGAVARKFDSFNTAGLSLFYDINLYKHNN